MKNWVHIALVLSALMLTIGPGAAHAAGFADAFRAFVLEDETATASTGTKSVSLPSDSQSAACMQCHNGSRGQAIVLKHADAAMNYTSHGNVDHPVGMSYSQYAGREPHAYVSPGRLDARIRLENGQVACTSCHGVKQTAIAVGPADLVASLNDVSTASASCTATKTLTTGPDTSRLCMSCHAM